LELGETDLPLGVLAAHSGRFPACERGFPGECRETVAKVLYPVDQCRGIGAGAEWRAVFRSHQTYFSE
jgi:hypothetical protein